MPDPLLKLNEGELYVAGPVEYVIREDSSLEDVLAHLVEESGNDPEHPGRSDPATAGGLMSCNLIRIRCERRYEREEGKTPDWPGPDFRVFDVPPAMANQIALWYRETGWDVLEEAI
jgi:hypothetical protein